MDKNKKYLIYCRSGRRSGKTLKKMKNLGYKEVYGLTGGMNQWKKERLPIIHK
ncbi:MAG: rhodanese-like domain-containing protein [Euryarchaeota archaeon]|nr:rhodanese-like domain-containing protein [Euryarchaeota archaeon]